MSNQPNYQSPTPPNNQPNYAQPYDPNLYQGQYPPQTPYGQNPYQAQYQPINYPYHVPNSIQVNAKIDRQRSNIAFVVCIVTFMLGGVFYSRNPQNSDAILSGIFWLFSSIAWVSAWCFSAKSKGYSVWLGLLSLLGLLGMLILMVIPNRNKLKY